MALLNDALPSVSSLIPLSKITIKSRVKTLKDGFQTATETSIDAYAHIQPLSNASVAKLTDNALLNAELAYRFWIVKDLAVVLEFLQNTQCTILWQGREYEVFSKEDWSQNGWIRVIATIKGVA